MNVLIVLLLVFLGLIGCVSVLLGLGIMLTGIWNMERDLTAWGAGMVFTPIFVAVVTLLAAS